jgi:hypothetical protein
VPSGSGQERLRCRRQPRDHSRPQSTEVWEIRNDSARGGPGAGAFGAHGRLNLGDSDHPVVVTMAPVRVVEVAADQIIHVVGVGDHVVPTA